MLYRFTTWERFMMQAALYRIEGNVEVLRKALKALDTIEIPEELEKKMEVRQAPDGSIQWKDEGRVHELQLDEDSRKIVLAAVSQLTMAGSAARRLVALVDKLGQSDVEEDFEEAVQRPRPISAYKEQEPSRARRVELTEKEGE